MHAHRVRSRLVIGLQHVRGRQERKASHGRQIGLRDNSCLAVSIRVSCRLRVCALVLVLLTILLYDDRN